MLKNSEGNGEVLTPGAAKWVSYRRVERCRIQREDNLLWVAQKTALWDFSLGLKRGQTRQEKKKGPLRQARWVRLTFENVHCLCGRCGREGDTGETGCQWVFVGNKTEMPGLRWPWVLAQCVRPPRCPPLCNRAVKRGNAFPSLSLCHGKARCLIRPEIVYSKQ